MTHGVNNYSVFFTYSFYDFTDDDEVIQKKLIESLNCICFENQTIEQAMPYAAWGDRKKLGNVNWLLASTEWSHCVYQWAKEWLQRNSASQVLEIGPGGGLMSSVLLKINPNISIDWVLFGDPDFVFDVKVIK